MKGKTPLVLRLAAVSLVALAIIEAAPAGNSGNNTSATARPARLSKGSRGDRPRSRRKRTTTTTTTTHHPYDDEEDDEDFDDMDEEPTTPLPTTTIDPRALDYTETGSCDVALGMENGLIANDSLSASSSYDQSVSPLSARIRTEIRGGAWCPNGLIHSRSRQYLEIDLLQEYLITAIETQGRFANSVGVEFVESFGIEYYRDRLKRWIKYKDHNGSRVLIPGNTNTYSTSKKGLEYPFVASKIRFYPYSQHPRTACMRLEVYGCEWKQDVVSYSAPRGGIMQTMAAGALFTDVTYDGLYRNNVAVDGLGQMTDSLVGPNDFELLDPEDPEGSRWVGWNRTIVKENVELTFNFTEPKMFYNVDLHTNNMFTKDVQLFKEADVYFSLDGERWQEDFITNEPKQDRVSEHARVIHIRLDNRTATHIKIVLKFQHDWILLSEVTFKTVTANVNMSEDYLDLYYRSDFQSRNQDNSDINMRVSLGLACAGIIGGGVGLGTLTVYLTRRIKRRYPHILKKPFCPPLRSSSRNRRNPRLALALATCPPIHMVRPAIMDEDYREPYNIWRETLNRRDKRDNQDQNEYNEIFEESEFPRPYVVRRLDQTENFYAATDIIHHTYPEEHIPRRQERTFPALFTSIKLPEADPPNGVAPLLDFPRGRMRPVTFLGEGPYGTLQICETNGIEELNNDEDQSDGEGSRLVVVKTMWRGCHNDVKAAFAREATWGAGLKHPQLARVLGLSLQEPPCAALDRGDAAPLPVLLRHDKKLNYVSLTHICSQIAAGMKYLESFELVHRDLAARNVTVSKDMTVKISDYAMFCTEFISDYHIMADGTRVPLRWLPWESILLGMYAPSSDVWSFGVTVWEIITGCAAKPYVDMSDDQVVRNAVEWRAGTNRTRVPAAQIPRLRELYDLMHQCWCRDPNQRPRFGELHRFLEHLAQGFTPPLSG